MRLNPIYLIEKLLSIALYATPALFALSAPAKPMSTTYPQLILIHSIHISTNFTQLYPQICPHTTQAFSKVLISIAKATSIGFKNRHKSNDPSKYYWINVHGSRIDQNTPRSHDDPNQYQALPLS